jgi:predicted small lipoprotein YifL
MLSRMKILLLAVLLLTGAASGLKGPLYRPDEAKKPGVTPAQSAETQKKKDTASGAPPGEQSQRPVTPPDPDHPDVPPDR